MHALVLHREHLLKLVSMGGRDFLMDRMIDRIREGFASGGRDGDRTPAREGFLRGASENGVIEWMPYHDPGKSVTVKMVAYTPDNPVRRTMPTIIGSLTRYDDVTGRLLAICDGVLPTSLRTGAASAVVSGLLAHPGSKVLGVVGAGAQAVTQAHALSRVLPLERVLVHDVDSGNAASYADRVDFLDLDVRTVPLEELEAESDVICTVTSVGVGQGPVLTGNHLRRHAHINAVGADLVGKFELPETLLREAFVTCDHRGQALREGECQQLDEADLGPDVMTLCADPELARGLGERLTVFDSTGFALEDHIAMDVILELAREAGIGDHVRLEHLPEDALNPYSFD